MIQRQYVLGSAGGVSKPDRSHGGTACRIMCSMGFAALLCVTGCGGGDAGGDSSNLSAEEEAALNQNISPAPPTDSGGRSQPVNAAAQDDTEAILKHLNREMIKWGMRTGQVPSTFEEFVAGAKIEVPPPPAGKKYKLNKDRRIVLVDI